MKLWKFNGKGFYGDKPEYDFHLFHQLLCFTEAENAHGTVTKTLEMVFAMLKSLEEKYGAVPNHFLEIARSDLQRWTETLTLVQ